jgi:hypothetical protein
LIRSQMLYPLSYERWASQSLACGRRRGEIGECAQAGTGPANRVAERATRCVVLIASPQNKEKRHCGSFQ